MRSPHIVSLVERVDCDLPVCGEHRRQVDAQSQTVQVVRRQQGRQRLEVLSQGRRSAVQADPDEATPPLDPHHLQPRIRRYRIELVFVDHLKQSSDREYCHAELASGDSVHDLVAFFEHGLVQADRSAPAIGTGIGTHELVDVGVGDRSGGGAHGRIGELSKELALATGEEHLGDPGGGKNSDVPGIPVGDVGQLLKAEPG
jgi:hypothetical protein